MIIVMSAGPRTRTPVSAGGVGPAAVLTGEIAFTQPGVLPTASTPLPHASSAAAPGCEVSVEEVRR
jgi:hypothetical protein